MQAAFIHGSRDLRLGHHEVRPPGARETTVTVAAVGICGSDLHYYKDGGIGTATIHRPFVPGHEFSAFLEQDIEPLGLLRGQLVAVDPATPCGHCEWCHRGHHNLCPEVVFIGAPPFDGALTSRLTVPLSGIVPIPDGMTAAQGAMLEPLGVCVHAIDLAKPKLLERVAVLGCGGIGLGIVQLLKRAGVGEIHAVEPQAHRGTLALRFGASSAGADLQAMRDATGGRGCELVIEATNSPRGLADAVLAARIGGRAVIVGIPDGDAYAGVLASEARRRGLDLRFSRRMGNVYPRAIELVQRKLVDVDAIVSHTVELEGVPDAFAAQADEATGLVKTIVRPGVAATPQ